METGIPGLNWDELKLKGFKVYELSPSVDVPGRTGRRDFYKMGLVHGEITIDFEGKVTEREGDFLFFVNPKVPHSFVRRVKRNSGYACIFTETFMNHRELQDSPLFSVGQHPIVPLDSGQAAFMGTIFQNMLRAYHGNYNRKADVIRNCIALITHEALRIQPPQQVSVAKGGAGRITHLFLDQLEKQFPIERSTEPLGLRTAQDFAEALAIHVNYLNRAVKVVTGKPTSVHIASRIAAEANALLQHTDWSVAEIAYALGFSYPAYFNHFFKRMAGCTPSSIRKV